MFHEPVLIKGGLAVDDRGKLLFCNDFQMEDLRRFYVVSNHEARFIRAWHAHKGETKYIFVPTGAAVVAAVRIDDWESPSKDAAVYRFVIGEESPAVVMVPPGFANGTMTLKPGTSILFFSNRTLDESLGDDFRYDAYHWNPWDVVER